MGGSSTPQVACSRRVCGACTNHLERVRIRPVVDGCCSGAELTLSIALSRGAVLVAAFLAGWLPSGGWLWS